MNKSQKIYFNTGNTGQDKFIKVKLEQDVNTLEFMTLKLGTEDIYQSFNADYGVLVGRVLANGGIGIPNAKISIFIPISDDDLNDEDIYSVYPYKTPRDKNNEGKRYNLLPRVARYDRSTSSYKPKQPFGSFPLKEEILVNDTLLKVYMKYYKYTSVTNEYGDYMIFGVPTGTQTIHLSVDITDIGKYSMTPASMINAGYSPNLFAQNTSQIKPSNDLTDLPNIETQEITVNITPFWGDVNNFEIGITRQDFRIRAQLSASFTIFGTSMTMGINGIFGNPDASNTNLGFYSLSNKGSGIHNNMDIRTYRTAKPTIRVFTYTNDVPLIKTNNEWTVDLSYGDPDTTIRELNKTEYIEIIEDGSFILNIPCNRVRVITNFDNNKETEIDENSSYGVFTKFFGMILVNYPDLNDLPENSSWSNNYDSDHPQHKSRGWFKIPQKIGLHNESADSFKSDFNNSEFTDNELWRRDYYSFSASEIYGVSQFYPTRKTISLPDQEFLIAVPGKNNNTENIFNKPSATANIGSIAGGWFKVAGTDLATQSENIDTLNYIVPPTTGATSQFVYDLPYNVKDFDNLNDAKLKQNKYFGGQWLNFCLFFPCYGWAYSPIFPNRSYEFADIFHGYLPDDISTNWFIQPNNQKLFAGIRGSHNILRGDAWQTTFIKIPKDELNTLGQIPLKGINVSEWNKGDKIYNEYYTGSTKFPLNVNLYKYSDNNPNGISTNGQEYYKYGWDDYLPHGCDKSAYIFKGMYENDCIKMLSDYSII